MTITIAELPAAIWQLSPTFQLRIDRSGMTVEDYLRERGIRWIVGRSDQADIELVKGGISRLSVKRCIEEVKRRKFSRKNCLTLIGEPRELAPVEYFFARKDRTLAVAPGSELKRLCFASEWIDPQLDDWGQRLDRICWIARPTPERIAIARQLVREGAPIDIYSREAWPLSEWKGYAEYEILTARKYRYRIVCENSSRFGYHSEKFFNSIRCGCVTFYQGDPSLDLSHARGAYLPLESRAVSQREELSRDVLLGIERFMYSSAWEIYSFRQFYNRVIDLSLDLINS